MRTRSAGVICTILLALASAGWLLADAAELPAQVAQPEAFIERQEFLTLRTQLRIIGFLTLLTLVPFGVMMMTSFTRISIIFQFLRSAMGSSQIPSNQIIIGLSLILTGFIMQPVIKEIQEEAFLPYFHNAYRSLPAVQTGQATEEGILLERSWIPLRKFLLNHVREKDLQLFLEIAKVPIPNSSEAEAIDAIPWYCLIPAFIMSELRMAFMLGFLLFLPFLIIDMVVAAILMSLGMMMLPPIMVSTPFKILLFILVDGWHLIIQQVVVGFRSGG